MRETFLLHWKEELSYRQIAERSNLSQETARQRVCKARAILRERWQEYDAEPIPEPAVQLAGESKATEEETAVEIPMLNLSESLAVDESFSLSPQVRGEAKAISFYEDASIEPELLTLSNPAEALENEIAPESQEVVLPPVEADWSDRFEQLPLVRNLTKNRVPIVGRAPCNGTQHTGILLNYKSPTKSTTSFNKHFYLPETGFFQKTRFLKSLAIAPTKSIEKSGLFEKPQVPCFKCRRRALADSGGLGTSNLITYRCWVAFHGSPTYSGPVLYFFATPCPRVARAISNVIGKS